MASIWPFFPITFKGIPYYKMQKKHRCDYYCEVGKNTMNLYNSMLFKPVVPRRGTPSKGRYPVRTSGSATSSGSVATTSWFSYKQRLTVYFPHVQAIIFGEENIPELPVPYIFGTKLQLPIDQVTIDPWLPSTGSLSCYFLGKWPWRRPWMTTLPWN